MSRKMYPVIAGWLAVASVGLAQDSPGAAPKKLKPLSPYHATASTTT